MGSHLCLSHLFTPYRLVDSAQEHLTMFKSLTYASLLAVASAQSLTEVIANTSSLSSLGSLLQASPELAAQLGNLTNVTVLAPSNEALSQLTNTAAGQAATGDQDFVNALLSYHVIQGAYMADMIPDDLAFVPTLLNDTQYANVTGGQRLGVARDDDEVTIYSGLLNNASVTTPNVNFTGGVVHVIDTVLTIPPSAADTLSAAGLSSLAGALIETDLVDTVNGLENVTIFAPSNMAFQNISSALANLTAENLTSILQYHVVVSDGPLYSTLLTNGTMVPTLQGGNVTIRINDDNVFVNNARVVTPNVLIAGGVVHVIDNVLNPANATAQDDGDDEEGSGAFDGATPGDEAPFTSGVPEPTTTIGDATPTGSPGSQATDAAATSSTAGAMPMVTGAVGAAALFGAGAAILNF